MKRSRLSVRTSFVLAITALMACFAACNDTAAEVTACSFDGNLATVTIRAEAYRIVEVASGHRIDMEDFDCLTVPGQPRLPIKRFLIALPPGARARSVEVLASQTTVLPGAYRIEPAPPIAFLPDMPRYGEAMKRVEREWQAAHDAVYLSEVAFPRRSAWLAARGTLRKYAYAAVAFCPFTYEPQSGRLEYHNQVELAIAYDLPTPDDPEGRLVDRLMRDRAADARARSLFSNYDAAAELYSDERHQPAPLDELYDYVIVTVSENVGAIAASGFPTWKTALGYSLRTVLTTDPEITGQPGGDLAEQIRNFLRAYYATWGIQYVLFVGDYATVPMRICYPDPDFHVYDPSDPGLVAPGTPTDYYYADLSFPDAVSWDSDGDGYHGEYSEDDPDFLAEVSVGRIPVNDSMRITYTLDKLVTFEQDTGAWKNNVLHGAAILFFENQNYGGYPFIDGATCLDSIETALMGGMTITHFSEQSGIVTSPFPWPALTEATFTSAWGSGEHAVVNWSGHGWSDGAYRTVWGWDDGDGVPESGNGEMQSHRFIGLGSPNLDDDHPSIIFAISCNVGYPDPNPYGNLGIDLLTLPGWGTSAGTVSSARPAAVAGDWKATGGGTEQICYDFNRYMIVENEKVGDALYDGKFYATDNYGWASVYEYMDLYNYNLYGDPALEVGGATAGVAGRRLPEPEIILEAIRPNPFGSATNLSFSMPAAGHVRMTVHDVRGRHVATLADGTYEAGTSAITWDGTGDRGERLASGLYFIAVKAGDETAYRKLILLK
jgi:hypothetical protein